MDPVESSVPDYVGPDERSKQVRTEVKGTIRFERVKMVRVRTRITYTMNSRACEELAFRDPGGSMYFPYMRTGPPATTYEVTYSYIGQPRASDEYGGRNLTFQVYFQPEELAPEVRQALTERKRDRARLAEYFTVNALRGPVRRIVIDEAQSHFCDLNFVDGMWTRSDANCKDEIYTKATAGLSDYITVRVDPVSALAASSRRTRPASHRPAVNDLGMRHQRRVR
jgi:hypothetical protein